MNEFRIKPSIYGHLVVIAAVIILAGITYWGLFGREDAPDADSTVYIIASTVFGIGAVVVFMALRIVILQPAIIRINDQGFEYNPGGVSSGFIKWTNVQELKRTEVRTTAGNLPGPVWETVIAIKLKDSSTYTNQFNPFIQSLMKLNDQLYDADIFFRISSFGKQATEVEALMMKHFQASK